MLSRKERKMKSVITEMAVDQVEKEMYCSDPNLVK